MACSDVTKSTISQRISDGFQKKFNGRCQIVVWEGLPSFTSIALFVFELSRIFGRGGGVKRPPLGQARVNSHSTCVPNCLNWLTTSSQILFGTPCDWRDRTKSATSTDDLLWVVHVLYRSKKDWVRSLIVSVPELLSLQSGPSSVSFSPVVSPLLWISDPVRPCFLAITSSNLAQLVPNFHTLHFSPSADFCQYGLLTKNG